MRFHWWIYFLGDEAIKKKYFYNHLQKLTGDRVCV